MDKSSYSKSNATFTFYCAFNFTFQVAAGLFLFSYICYYILVAGPKL